MTTRNRVRTALTFAAAVLLATFVSIAHAAVVTSQSSTAPTSNVVISQTTNESGSPATPWRTQSGLRQPGQTFFVASGFVLDKITVNIASIQNGDLDGDSFTLFIDSYTNGTDTTPDSNLLTEVGNLPASMLADFNGGNTFLTLDLTDTALLGGQQYGFVLAPTGFSNTSNFLIEAKMNSTYTSGIGLANTGGGPVEAMMWDGSQSQPSDLEFYLQAAPAVPEPSGIAIAALGSLALIGTWWRRRKWLMAYSD